MGERVAQGRGIGWAVGMAPSQRWLGLLLVLLGTSLAERPALRAQPPPPPAAGLDAVIEAHMREASIVGLAGAVLVDNRLVWAKGYGFHDVARSRPFTTETPVSVASIAKTVVGVAMMQLVAEGRLSLDADVAAYLPFPLRNPRFPEQPITLRMLATHTSSVTDRWEVYREVYRFAGAPERLGDFLADYFSPRGRRYSDDNYLATVPGSVREYSNLGAALVGLVVERLTGKRLDRYTSDHVFVPLGLRATGWVVGGTVRQDVPVTRFVAQGGLSLPILPYSPTTYPDGGLYTSVTDLSRVFLALLNRGAHDGRRILPEREADEMLRFQFSGPVYPKGYGPGQGNSGLFWRTKFGGSRMGHGGNDPGVQAEMLASLDRRLAVILLCNTSVTDPGGDAFGKILDVLWTHGESRLR